MNLQWAVIVTQILGFLIVLMVLRAFAWGPILKMLEERREKIRTSFQDIETQKQDVAALKHKYEDELKKIDAVARQRMNEVLAEAQKMAQDIEAAARERSQAEMTRLKAEIEQEYRSARVKLRDEIVSVALNAAERMVKEKLDRTRQSALVDQFLTDLEKKA